MFIIILQKVSTLHPCSASRNLLKYVWGQKFKKFQRNLFNHNGAINPINTGQGRGVGGNLPPLENGAVDPLGSKLSADTS